MHWKERRSRSYTSTPQKTPNRHRAMEESAKRRERRERLATLNLENYPIPTHLYNPFNESAPPEASPDSAKFDFYTDPVVAFSGQKRKIYQSSPTYISPSTNPASPLSRPQQPQPSSSFLSPGTFDMSPSSGCSSSQKSYEATLTYPGPGPWRSPIRMGNSSFRGPQGTPPGRGWNSPVRSNPFPGHQGTPPGRGYSSNSSRGSPYHNLGRGSGQRNSSTASPGSGKGNHGSVASARERPDMFYKKSMLEDPWRSLKPVVRTLSWLLKSIREKKDNDSGPSIGFNSGTSLAHLLAATFNEVTGDGKEAFI